MHNLEWIFSMRPTTDSENRWIKENRIQRQKEIKPKKKTKIWITSGLLAFYAISTYVFCAYAQCTMHICDEMPVCQFASLPADTKHIIEYIKCTSHRQLPKENPVFVALR